MRNIMNFFITHFPPLKSKLDDCRFFSFLSLSKLRLLLLLFNINVLLACSNGDYSWLDG